MPNRTLRAGIITSDKWNAASWIAQSLYVRILALVDDFGRYDARPTVLRAYAFPLNPEISTEKVTELCSELASHGLILIYEVDAKPFLQLTNWRERIRLRTPSKWPEPLTKPPIKLIKNENLKNENSTEKPEIVSEVDKNGSAVICQSSASHLPVICPLEPTFAVGGGGGVGVGVGVQQTDIELPHRFPPTIDDAYLQADLAGVPKDFCDKVWNKAMSRNGCDGRNIPIHSFCHHLKTEWVYEQDRIGRQRASGHSNGHSPGGQAPVWRQIEAIEQEIAKHPANRESVYHDRLCTDAQKADLKSKRQRLRELSNV